MDARKRRIAHALLLGRGGFIRSYSPPVQKAGRDEQELRHEVAVWFFFFREATKRGFWELRTAFDSLCAVLNSLSERCEGVSGRQRVGLICHSGDKRCFLAV